MDIDYDFDAWHIGMILVGHNIKVTACLFAEHLGCQLLYAARDHETASLLLNFFLPDSTP